tara:strand:- start:255 stop:533 length:279 start_codon:yes stop_codon:yes gene_type:complete
MSFFDWLLGKVWDKPQAKEAPAPKSQSRAELARYLEPGLIALLARSRARRSIALTARHRQTSTIFRGPRWFVLHAARNPRSMSGFLYLTVND